ncbi:MAG: four helix bundle protein [Patescibacteria group bacterium]
MIYEKQQHISTKPYHSLLAWKEAHALVRLIYSYSNTFPKHELYGLTSQLRRAAVSVPTNIVEGYARKSIGELKYFLNIAKASMAECEYLTELAHELTYLTDTNYLQLEDQRARASYLLNHFIKSKQ